jgi:RsiW-degrading membrane proteinase PrsW (M82 family)
VSIDAPAGGAIAAGWYPDPVRGFGWRWWDGRAWTVFTDESVGGAAVAKRPRRRWLSVPVMVCAPLVGIGVVVALVFAPIAVLAGLVPLAVVLPVVSWFDRIEPEPRSSRAHALLWGASVAVVVALVVNTVVAYVVGEVASMVVSAPLVEEAMKGLGVVWAVRRREVDGVSDGIVYAAWVAVGFAVVEDMSYFVTASVQGSLVPVFVVRAILTPFAHPLFTFWTGLAIGRAVRSGRSVFPRALWGYALAVASHALWNGSLAIADIRRDIDEQVAALVVLVVAGLFVLLFLSVLTAVVVMRRHERDRFVAGVPAVVFRHRLGPDEAVAFTSWRAVIEARRRIPRSKRRQFDAMHAAIARLVLLADRTGGVDPADEAVLAAQLSEAREALRGSR